jgi:uncharacterized membrane protein (DUF2068 family)
MLLWIVAFKAVKTILLATLGAALLFAVHRDPVELVLKIARAIQLPLTSRLVAHALTLALRATPRREETLAIAAFGYAVLMGTEGVGLYLRRPWARWFTIAATGSLIPIEIYEIAREPRLLRILILVLNIAVVAYLWKRKEIFQ